MPKHTPRGNRAASYLVLSVAQPAPAPERPKRWPKLVSLVLGIVLAAGAAQWSAAQRRDTPRIIVAPTIMAQPASQAALSIEVGPPDALPDKSFVRLRGFPTTVSLNQGHAIAPGAWAIPLFGLRSLKAIVPAGVSGRTDIMISLVGVDGITLAESKTALVIAAPTPPARPASQALPRGGAVPLAPPRQPRRAAPAAPELPPDQKARAERMLALGSRHLEQGNIGAARMFFQRAADAGLAAGALELGSTYDPVELDRLDALVITPDRDEARKWYERARQLGAPEAEYRLGRLRGGR